MDPGLQVEVEKDRRAATKVDDGEEHGVLIKRI